MSKKNYQIGFFVLLAYSQMAECQRATIREITKRESELMVPFFGHLRTDGVPDWNKDDILGDLMAMKRRKIVVTYNHFKDLKGDCDAAQLAKFDKVITKITPKLANPN